MILISFYHFKLQSEMLRLQEFITIIRNTKTIAEERAEYQKEMAAIRESFAKHEEALRPRNVTKLLFINMSGQQTNFGQMECLNLITANSLIEKRIGYLGLTQLFHEKSELLMMATNRLRVDLTSSNNSIVGLVLCVVSEICTTELARQLHNEVLKCITNNSAYIRKKAILTAIRIIKKCPEYIPEFLAKVLGCLHQKNHGVLLSTMAFLENVIALDESFVKEIVNNVSYLGKVYKMIAQEHNTQYQIGGVQDPFLQVAILKLLRILKKYTNSFDKNLIEILVISHDSVCSKISNNMKNGANAVLLQCFQCFMLLEPTNQLKDMVANVLSKFISVKDANSKYLSLFNLSLMAKYDLNVVKNHKSTIFECLDQNDNLIRNMGLDLLYLIAEEDNAATIVKQLLNTLLTATDQDFIPELALKICLIVEKHSQSRRWHFDTILKVLILADQSVKQQSAKSLVHLVTSTPTLQNYCMAKLFYSTCDNIQNDALAKICIYLLGQLGEVLLKNRELGLTQTNILDLVESVMFRIGVLFDTIAYGLSALLKLYQKFPSEKARISKMIKSFETHSDLQVQKRACEYSKLLQSAWDEQRNTEICIPVPPFRETAEAFKSIPIGQTNMDIDLRSIKLPKKMNINYEDHMSHEDQGNRLQRQVAVSTGKQHATVVVDQKKNQKVSQENQQVATNAFGKKKVNIMDDDDIFNSITGGTSQPVQTINTPTITQHVQKQDDDPFGLLSLNVGGTQPQPVLNQPSSTGFEMGLLGFGTPNLPVQQPQIINQPNGGLNLLGDDFLGMGGNKPPVQQPVNIIPAQNIGFNFNPTPVQSQGFGWGNQQVQQPQVAQQQNTNKFLAYENPQIQIWMNCIKQSGDTAKIIATYTNKTQSLIEGLSVQIAVMKHLKLTINPLNNTTLQPLSKQSVSQSMSVVNSAVGQKGIVMKVKIGYSMNGQKLSFQQKIDKFPANM